MPESYESKVILDLSNLELIADAIKLEIDINQDTANVVDIKTEEPDKLIFVWKNN